MFFPLHCSGSVQATQVLPYQSWHSTYLWPSLSAQGHRLPGAGLGFSVPVKQNLKITTLKDILDRVYVLHGLWQQFREEPFMCVMVRCPDTFGHLAYILLSSKASYNEKNLQKLTEEKLQKDSM